RIVVVVEGERQLLEVVLAAGPVGSLAHLLHGGQEQADEDGDDGDHHQQLDQRERAASPLTGVWMRRHSQDLRNREMIRTGKHHMPYTINRGQLLASSSAAGWSC